jgi:hypothetical protein
MSDLQFYLRGVDDKTSAFLRRQWSDAVEKRTIKCTCGKKRALELAFRCLYCGVWFCADCAGEHFGDSREWWRGHNMPPKLEELHA